MEGSVRATYESLLQSVVPQLPCRHRTRSPPPYPAWANPALDALGKTEQNPIVRATLQSKRIAGPLRSCANALGSDSPTTLFLTMFTLVPTNAQVLTEPINSAMVGNRSAKFPTADGHDENVVQT